MNHHNYLGKFILMVGLSFLSMYGLMFVMANSLVDVYNNLNQFYMAALMSIVMVIIETILMGNKTWSNKINYSIIIFCFILSLFFFWSIRQQFFISDKQFLKSMIPHHSGAILMCQKAVLQDSEIKNLCQNIVVNQRAEIAKMKIILERLDN